MNESARPSPATTPELSDAEKIEFLNDTANMYRSRCENMSKTIHDLSRELSKEKETTQELRDIIKLIISLKNDASGY